MRLAIFEAMSQSPRDDQRLWFVVDELDALGAIDGLKDALARLRGAVLRRQVSRGQDRESGLAARGGRRSRSTTHNHVIEPAVMASELEQLPDLCGYLKTASSAVWLKVAFTKG